MHFAHIPRPGRLLLGDALFRIKEGDKKPVYLTFDDGPVPEATPQILDILQKYHVKATFFCVGENVKKYPQIFQRIIKEGHSVGNHTYNHLNGWKTDNRTYIDNIDKCAEVVQSKLFRPPYGRIKYSQYRKVKKKFRVVMWDVLSGDYDRAKNTEYCLGIVKKNLRSGSVVVFHDSVKAAPKIPVLLTETLEFIKKRGFEAKPLSSSF